MGGHALRGAVTAWLMLIALQTIGTNGGSGRLASFFADADNLVKRVLDPKVPAIPDRRGGVSAGDTPSPALNGLTPNQLRNAAQNIGIISTPAFQQGVANGTGNLSQSDITRLEQQLGGFANYTPAQLAQAWGQG